MAEGKKETADVFVSIALSIPGCESVGGMLERDPDKDASPESIFKDAHNLLNELIIYSRDHPITTNRGETND